MSLKINNGVAENRKQSRQNKINKIMKNNKLKLNDLKINSFVTALNDKKAQTVQGGLTLNHCNWVSYGFTCAGYDSIFPCKSDIAGGGPY